MSTFQAIVYGIIHGFSEFLPISSSAHHLLISWFWGWPAPEGVFLGALSLGATLALLIRFRHDWASMISSLLQILVYRRKPMSMDERMPFFVLLATLPAVAGWYYFSEALSTFKDPLVVAAILAGAGLPLWFSDSMSRKNKRMYDWNWLDSLLIGLAQILNWIPGAGRMMGGMTCAATRNFTREAAAKFLFYTSTPILAGSTILRLRELNFHDAMPMSDMSWVTFHVTVVVTTLASLLAIGGFLKHVQKTGVDSGMGRYFVYRCLVAVATGVAFWMRTKT